MADLRLAHFLAALSQVTDLGMGQPAEAAVRSCLLATDLARRMGIDERDVSDIYYTALLQHVGCTAYAHETTALFGVDDIALRAGGSKVDFANPREALGFMLLELGKGTAPLTRALAIVTGMRLGATFDEKLHRSNCEVAVRVADRLALKPGTRHGLNHVFERWDGKGYPDKIRQHDIALPARFVQVAGQGVLFDQLGGPDLAIETVRRRAGSSLDPGIAAAFARHGRSMLNELDGADAMRAVIDAEPEPHQRIPDSHLDEMARAFGDTVDLKSPFTHGHSTGVARLAEQAASALGLPESEISDIRRAGFLHDLGRAGIPNGILDKPGPLTTTEWDQVQLHPYHSERILSRSQALAPLASLAGMHHERLDGSGYHRQCPAPMIPVSARILAAANMYRAMTEERPYRPAYCPESAAERVTAEAASGSSRPDAASAVLTVAGHAPPPTLRAWPNGLSDREVQVLRLVAQGRSNREIGEALFISPKTADHHVQHVYAKIDVSTRAGAAMFAMQHDLFQNPRTMK